MVDEFVVLDDVQFTRRDWRNRNLIKTAQGVQWLSIPVVSKGKYLQKICETKVMDSSWAPKHWRAIQHAYGKAPFIGRYAEILKRFYDEAAEVETLSEVNRIFLKGLCGILGIETVLSSSAGYELSDGKTDRLFGICRQAGADCYLSGPAARDYLDEAQFRESGIAVEWMDYAGYPDYDQLHGDFDPKVSILDLLLNVGPDAPEYMLSFKTSHR